MFTNIIEVFKTMKEKDPDIIFKNYYPKKGSYYLLTDDGLSDEIIINEENIPKEFDLIKKLDFYSQVISNNKTWGSAKLKFIFSNNFLSITINKKNLEKLNDNNIDERFNSILKGKSNIKKIKPLIDKDIKPIDINLFEKIKSKMKNIEIDPSEDRIKIFYITDDEKETLDLYENEFKRYLYQYVFLSNNKIIEDEKNYMLPHHIN